MHVAFRTDASFDIGHGHVMRCLTLAHALREREATCLFICRAHAGHLIERIRHDGFRVIELPAPELPTELPGSPAGWLGAAPDEDATQTLAALPDAVDWLVADHYAIDASWESRLRAACTRLLVIDDLANRPHDCDLLLDQNPGRACVDYERLVPIGCTVLAGPSLALLRPEFPAHRQQSLARPRTRLKKLMISMGGVDQHNTSTRVLDALNQTDLPDDLKITVVLGATAPWQDNVRQAAARMRWPTRVRVDVRDMAGLMAESDLAIGAGGGSALERCCLGLPSIIIPVADNQLAGSDALARAGAAILASLEKSGACSLPQALENMRSGDCLQMASTIAATITDGTGATRLATQMLDVPAPRLRLMRESDLERVLAWRNDPEIRRWMLNPAEIAAEEHAAWFRRCSHDPNRQLLIAEANGSAFGFVQFSGLSDPDEAEWGFYVAPEAPRGSGALLGQLALAHAFCRLGLPRLRGRALAENEASIGFHRKLGFRPHSCPPAHVTPPMRTFELQRDEWEAVQGAIT